MDWSKVTSVIGDAAPLLGTLLGGPAGGAVGALVANALGAKNDPDSVIQAYAANPDAIAKLQELQISSKVQLEQLAVTAEQNRMAYESNKLAAATAQFSAEAADRESARHLAAASPRDWVRPMITFAVLTGAMIILVIVFSGWGQAVLSNPTASLTVGAVIGFWFNVLNNCMAFWFGATKDGAQQSKDIAKFATTPSPISLAVSKDNN